MTFSQTNGMAHKKEENIFNIVLQTLAVYKQMMLIIVHIHEHLHTYSLLRNFNK